MLSTQHSFLNGCFSNTGGHQMFVVHNCLVYTEEWDRAVPYPHGFFNTQHTQTKLTHAVIRNTEFITFRHCCSGRERLSCNIIYNTYTDFVCKFNFMPCCNRGGSFWLTSNALVNASYVRYARTYVLKHSIISVNTPFGGQEEESQPELLDSLQ